MTRGRTFDIVGRRRRAPLFPVRTADPPGRSDQQIIIICCETINKGSRRKSGDGSRWRHFKSSVRAREFTYSMHEAERTYRSELLPRLRRALRNKSLSSYVRLVQRKTMAETFTSYVTRLSRFTFLFVRSRGLL